MDKMIAPLLVKLFLPAMDQIQHFTGIFFCKWFQWVQTVTIAGQSNRHHGYTLKLRHVGGQFPDGAFQFRSVIDSTAQNDLTIHDNTCVLESLHLVKNLSCKPIVQHLAAQLWIHSLE